MNTMEENCVGPVREDSCYPWMAFGNWVCDGGMRRRHLAGW